eukprot:TRINITY_DN9648_c0_g2_i6.p4 TRINITY_DN9648_c0_g2~~TRINITY_DN9648_c0_g2_i6.p4  ORF type:complete len:116 (-),score=2.83 TRINITY_DN9648_c0_g2_i6:513-860(-)
MVDILAYPNMLIIAIPSISLKTNKQFFTRLVQFLAKHRVTKIFSSPKKSQLCRTQPPPLTPLSIFSYQINPEKVYSTILHSFTIQVIDQKQKFKKASHCKNFRIQLKISVTLKIG